MVKILSGVEARNKRKVALMERVQGVEKTPKLAIVQVGERADSTAYIEQKKKFGESIGAVVEHYKYELEIPEHSLIEEIFKLNNDESVHGIIVQLPLPESLNAYSIIEAIDPLKDVDGLTSENVKILQSGGMGGFTPATARGIELLLHHHDVEIEGKYAVVVGRSQLVGAPTAHMLTNHGATVTVCHKLTQDLAKHTREADILVVATGNAHLITKDHVKEGQVVVDVGINSVEGTPLQEELPDRKFTGDVNFAEVSEIVEAISPVPGGVGPMTVLALFENLMDAYVRLEEINN